MTKEEIEKKFKNVLNKIYKEYENKEIYFPETEDYDGFRYRLLKEAFNLGLEVAADNVEFDTFTLSESAEIQLHKLIMNNELEIGVIRNSILQHKLKI